MFHNQSFVTVFFYDIVKFDTLSVQPAHLPYMNNVSSKGNTITSVSELCTTKGNFS